MCVCVGRWAVQAPQSKRENELKRGKCWWAKRGVSSLTWFLYVCAAVYRYIHSSDKHATNKRLYTHTQTADSGLAAGRLVVVVVYSLAIIWSIATAIIRAGRDAASEFYRASGGSIKSVYSLAGPIDYNTIYRARASAYSVAHLYVWWEKIIFI